MLPFYKKYWRTVFDIALLLVTAYLFFILFRYLFEIGKPIFIGFIIFLIIEPLANFLHKKGLKKMLASIISTLLFIIIISGIFTILGAIFTTQVEHLSESIPKYAHSLENQITHQTDVIKQKINHLPNNVDAKFKEYTSNLVSKASQFASHLLMDFVGGLYSKVKAISELVFALILGFLMSAGKEKMAKNYSKYTPKTFKNAFVFLKENVGRGITGYIRAQLLLMLFTFIILFVSFLFLKVPNGFSIAALAALFSFVPVVGTATVLAPWIIYLLITGSTSLAVKLIVLLVIVVFLRHIIEPKLMADSLGVSAFTMLSFMVVSVSIFKIIGLFLTPIFIIVVKSLFEQGYLKKWIHLPEDEFDKVSADSESK